ncbi:hypothetical protein JTB14_016444 [Gonioctena quinquepunctata]|nr:hypothetical protein JTB14_016444 [Gonioctena quinquepunctata]
MKPSIALFFLFLSPHVGSKQIEKDPSVLIVGAGAAGISAATRLLRNGFRNIRILEAEPRIGGRIHTVSFGDSIIELVARWVHGQKNNVVYETVKDMDLLGDTRIPKIHFHSSGKQLEDSFAQELMDTMDSIYKPDGDYPPQYSSLGQYCEENFNKTIYAKYGSNTEKLEIAKAALDTFELNVLSNEGSNTWFETASHTDYMECEGNLALNWKGKGYKTFLNILMEKFPNSQNQLPIDDKILLNKEVKEIDWKTSGTKNRIKVQCADDSIYFADHLIFTPSLGVLKERNDYMFIPKLPEEKRTAIDKLGYGPVMKVVLHYEKKWWESFSDGFFFIWSLNDRKNAIKDFPEPNFVSIVMKSNQIYCYDQA